MEMLACEAVERHSGTYRLAPDSLILRDEGHYHWRAGGEKHLNDPGSVAALQVSEASSFVLLVFTVCFAGICCKQEQISI